MTMAQSTNPSRFAPAQSNPGSAAAQKAQEIAAKLSQTLTGQPYVANVAGSVSVTMDIPVEKVGLVIGRSGSTIREIQDTSGTRLQLDSFGEPTRQLRIIGSRENVEAAKNRLQALISQPTLGGYQAFRPTKTMQIPSECVGFVIGKGGETIKRISQETGCRLQVEDDEEARRLGHTPPMPGHQNLHLIGSSDSVSRAEGAVIELLEKKQRSMGRGGYNGQQTQAYQLRTQPYPAYAPAQYAQVAQQAYTLAPQGYAPNQIQGYGSYAPQAVYPSYAPQIPQQQTALGYPQTYTSTAPQAYPYPQSQQAAPAGQLPGYTPAPISSTQGYLPNAQQAAVGEPPVDKQNAVGMSNGQQMPVGIPPNGVYAGMPPNGQFMPPAGMPNIQQGGPIGAPQPTMSQMGPVPPPMNQPSHLNKTADMKQMANPAGSSQCQANVAGIEGLSN